MASLSGDQAGMMMLTRCSSSRLRVLRDPILHRVLTLGDVGEDMILASPALLLFERLPDDILVGIVAPASRRGFLDVMGAGKLLSSFLFPLTLSLALAIEYLRTHREFRQRWFADLCNCLVSDEPKQQVLRCSFLKDVKGDVLELGPGPATNMECLAAHPEGQIKSYLGIEPNEFMHVIFHNKTAHLSLGFPVELMTLEGEKLGLPDASFDTAVFTHVLCSVRDATQVLAEVERVLKPGGKVFFLEHIASPKGSWMRLFQKTIEPVWSIALDGCTFADTHVHLDEFREHGEEGFDVHYEFYDAPMSLAFVKPHLMGHAVKRGGKGEGGKAEL